MRVLNVYVLNPRTCSMSVEPTVSRSKGRCTSKGQVGSPRGIGLLFSSATKGPFSWEPHMQTSPVEPLPRARVRTHTPDIAPIFPTQG